MPAPAPAGLLSLPFGVPGSWVRPPDSARRIPAPEPGVGGSWFLLLGLFCLSCIVPALGPGAAGRAPCGAGPPRELKLGRRAACGRRTGARGSRSLHPAPGSRGQALLSLYVPRFTRMAPPRPGQPNKPCSGYFIWFPPPPTPIFLWPSPDFALVPFFVLVLCSPGLEPVTQCPSLPRKQLLFPLDSFAAIGSTTQTTSVTKLVLTGQSPVPELTSRGLTAWLRWDMAARGSGMLPEQPLAWCLPAPQKHKAGSGPGDGVSHHARVPWGIHPQETWGMEWVLLSPPWAAIGRTTWPMSPWCC